MLLANRKCAYGELSFSSRCQHTAGIHCHGSTADSTRRYVTVNGPRRAEFAEFI